MNEKPHRRPVEAIESRNLRTVECEQRVRKAVTKLAKTGLPFTVEEVCRRSGVGKTFVYDKKRPELKKLVLDARDASQLDGSPTHDAEDSERLSGWRTRAINAEARVKELRQQVLSTEARVSSLTGQLFNPHGTHLADENALLQKQVAALNEQVTRLSTELASVKRSLQASRVTIRREQERSLSLVETPLRHN